MLNGDKKTSGIIKEPEQCFPAIPVVNFAAYRASGTRDPRSSVENPSRRYPVDFRYPSILSRLASSQQCQRRIVVSQGKSAESSSSGVTIPSSTPEITFGSIVLVGGQTVREFPVEFSRSYSISACGSENLPLYAALQPHDPDAGIPVGKRLPADRAVGYGAALNKKISFS